MKSILFSACIALATLGNAAAFDETETPDVLAELEFSSSWRNQSGSTMTLYFDGKGGISGNFINRSAGTGCQDTSYPLTGRYYGTIYRSPSRGPILLNPVTQQRGGQDIFSRPMKALKSSPTGISHTKGNRDLRLSGDLIRSTISL